MTDAPAHPRYSSRTVAWGHWGITFLDVQPDHSKNYGVPVASIGFAVSTRGPFVDAQRRAGLEGICRAWIESGDLPADAVALARTEAA